MKISLDEMRINFGIQHFFHQIVPWNVTFLLTSTALFDLMNERLHFVCNLSCGKKKKNRFYIPNSFEMSS